MHLSLIHPSPVLTSLSIQVSTEMLLNVSLLLLLYNYIPMISTRYDALAATVVVILTWLDPPHPRDARWVVARSLVDRAKPVGFGE